MARWLLPALGGLLLTVCAASCLGGQTGEPTFASCESVELASDALWEGQTAAEWVTPFVGTHRADLHWLSAASSSLEAEVVGSSDSVSITLSSDGVPALENCRSSLTVAAYVVIETRANALHDEGQGWLTFERPESAPTLEFLGEELSLSATLSAAASGRPPEGTLRSDAQEAPGPEAAFPSLPAPARNRAEGGAGGARP
ncbi:MAG TPA: hypothetical protein VJN18_15185 [Polyangiaceae bacterium]|nr:hypothetical protein [Polyangiaceae bacterium]